MSEDPFDSPNRTVIGFRWISLMGYSLAMALPAQDTLRTIYGIECFVFSLAAAISMSGRPEMLLLFWGGYVNIGFLILLGTWLLRARKLVTLEAFACAILILALINVSIVAYEENRLQIGFYLWFGSAIVMALAALMQLSHWLPSEKDRCGKALQTPPEEQNPKDGLGDKENS